MEGDIKACFDEISHPALMDRVRARVGDKRVLALVKAFLKAGILGEDRVLRENTAGTPQGSILSPLLSNVALSVLDEHIAQAPGGPGVGRVATGQTAAPRSAQLPAGPVRGRLVPGRARHPGRRRSAAGGDRRGPLHDGPAPVGGEDPDHPHRRGPRLPRLAHPAPPQARHQPALRLHLPGQEGPGGRHGEGEDALPEDRHEPAARCPARPAQPGCSGLVRLLPARGVLGDLRLPERLPVAQVWRWLRRKHPKSTWKETPPPLLRRRMVAGRNVSVQPRHGDHRCYRYRGTKIPTPWPVTG